MSVDGMDILAAVFFVVAGGWLFVAVFYSCLMLVFLQMRRRGELDSMYDEEFGRVYLFGNHYIPMGCLIRRLLRHLLADPDDRPNTSISRFMTRDERRTAMGVLLGKSSTNDVPLASSATASSPPVSETTAEESRTVQEETSETVIDEEEGEVHYMCSICLGDYEDKDNVLVSSTCTHKFHRDCLLDWLQRNGNTECPCCRVPMVDEDSVWNTVRTLRKEKRKAQQRRSTSRWFGGKKETAASSSGKATDENGDAVDGETESSDITEVGDARGGGTFEEESEGAEIHVRAVLEDSLLEEVQEFPEEGPVAPAV